MKKTNIPLSRLRAATLTSLLLVLGLAASAQNVVIEVRVADGLDDAEEHLTEANAIDITSSDLELGAEGGGGDIQAIGIRFRNVDVPVGSTIIKAYIQFTVDEADTEDTSVRIFGELSGNPVEYSTAASDVTSRKKTTASVDWNNIPVWDDASIGLAGLDQRTPDLSAIVRELIGQVGQSGWTAKNAMSFIIMPNPGGERTAESFNGVPEAAALLHIEYVPAGGKPPIANGLVAYWNFEGNFKDQAGKFDGTEQGSTPIAFVNGKTGFGKSIKMNGEDQFVEISGGEPDDLAFAGGNMSIAGWFKVDAFDTSWQALVAKGEGSNWRIHRRGAESGFAHAGGTGEGPAGTAVDDGQWHHFAAISDQTAAAFGTALYVDGVQYSVNATAPSLAANGKRVMIGENPDARNREWEGEIDDLAIWNRVLTEAEIGQLYAKGAGKPLSELLGAVVGDADKDGIPDAAEILYGLNPNDPTDAAKDFDNDGVSNLDEYKAGTDPVDVTKPAITAVASSASFDKVTLTFSEELDPATATVAANYSISPALAVTAATYNRRVVTLTTAKQTPGATAYTVTVKGLKDTSKNEIAADTKAVFYSYMLTRTGLLKFSYWTGITGTPVDNLLSDANYPASPTGVGAIFSFNSRDFFPTDALDNYGAVIEGYLTPTESASYDFFLRSDDASLLFLSTDDKEANLVQVAEEGDCCDAFMEPSTGDGATTAAPISLVAGRKYFVRVIYKEGGGGDFAQVAWRKSTDKTPAGSLLPIPGQFLSAAVDLPAPAEGAFAIRSPAPNAKNVKPVNPITIAHRDGKTEWTAANVTLKFDGVEVKPTFSKAGNLATIEHKPSTLLPSKSTHTISLGYLDPGGKPATLDWSFETAEYKGPIKDVVKGYEGLILGSAKITEDKGGFSGKAGDLAIDFGRGSGQSVLISDASFLNAAAAGDQVTFSIWAKKYDTANNSVFWADSPLSSGSQRGFQAHLPWSDNNIYFDTAGCCDNATQRISAGIDTFPSFTGNVSWWTNTWRHFAFTKNAGRKQIWIDGTLFLEGESTSPLPTDFTRIWLGAEGGGPNAGTANSFHGLQDDFAIFGTALSEADIKKLAAGGAPSSLGAATKLVAHWDFNSALPVAAAKFTKISRNADGTITLEWTGGGTLESAPSVTGPWQAVTGAASPYKFSPTGTQLFGRIKQ